MIGTVLVPLLVVTTTTLAYCAPAQAMTRHPRNYLASHAPNHHAHKRSKHHQSTPSHRAPSTESTTSGSNRSGGSSGGTGSNSSGTGSSSGSHNPRGDAALHFAEAQVGKPYRWGATGPDAYDCSGLALSAWHAAGVTLPRTSEAQSRVGSAVSLSQAQPGDLVIFYPSASHVGIYAGNGRVIAAPRPGETVGYADIRWMPLFTIRRPA